MLSVLVLGATGFIALPITKALRRNNYTVYALIRNAARSNEFLREEIIPIIGDISKPETWAEKAAQVDVVINASSAEFDAIVLNTVLKIAEQRPKEKAKLLYIFVGGTWVHGDNLTPVNDFTPPIPRELTSNRINVERQILSTATRALVDILILRPVLLYGGSASLFDLWFKPLAQAAKSQSPTLSLGANPLSLVGLVHKEDLAEAVKLFVEKGSVLSQVSHPLFDIASSVESLQGIIDAAARAFNYKGKIEYVPAGSVFERHMSSSFVSAADRTRDLTGWNPKHRSFTAGMDTYVKAYQAHYE